MTDKRIFPARDIDSSKSGWIADLSPAHIVNPDCYYAFRTRHRAQEFIARVDAGEPAGYVYAAMIEQSNAAAALGAIKSERKAKSSATNGKSGGRPKKV